MTKTCVFKMNDEWMDDAVLMLVGFDESFIVCLFSIDTEFL